MIEMNAPSIRPGSIALTFGQKKTEKRETPAASPAVMTAAPSATPASNLLQAYSGVRFAGDTEEAAKPHVISADDILANVSKASQTKFEESKSVMSFKEFLNLVIEDPYRYLPTASSYAERGLLSYGVEKKKVLGKDTEVYDFAHAPWKSELTSGVKGIVGQEDALFSIVKKLREFQDHGRPNRIILLLGPKGNGKSVIFQTVAEALENYSNTPEGTRYTFSWNFPHGSPIRPMPALMSADEAKEYDKRMGQSKGSKVGPGEQLPANMNAHPLFLLPKEQRIELIKKLKEAGKIRKEDNFDYFIEGDLDVNSRAVYDALFKAYKGDLNKLYNNVLVESWTMSEQSGRGLAKISPSKNRDAFMQSVTPDINWNRLPGFLKGLKWLGGMLPEANGGIFNMDDMGRDMDPARYLYQLLTAETGETIIEGNGESIKEQLDVILVGSINPESLMKMAKEGQLQALRDRMDIIVSGHLREYEKEAEIYRPYVETAEKKGRVVGPHVLDTFGLFMTMTRLFPVNSQFEDYGEAIEKYPELKTALEKLDPLSKALLYQGEDVNSYTLGKGQKFTEREQKLLRQHLGTISDEYISGVGDSIFFAYEGGLGLSAREGQDLFQDIVSAHKDQPLTILDMFEQLAREFKEPAQYYQRMGELASQEVGDRLPKAPAPTSSGYGPYSRRPQTSSSAFKTPRALLKDVEGHARRQTQMEIKRALKLFRDPDDYVKMLAQYMVHVDAYNQKTMVKDVAMRSPGKQSTRPDDKMMRRVEGMIAPNVGDAKALEDFREDIVGKLGSGFDPSKSLEDNIREVLSNEVQKMISHDEQQTRAKLDERVKDLISYWEDPSRFKQLGMEDRRTELEEALQALEEKGYPQETLPSLIDWAFSDKFISEETYKVRRATKDDKR